MGISTIKKAKEHIKESIKLLYILPEYKLILEQYRKCKKRKIILIGSPAHGNLGDHAIAVSEINFIQDYKKDEVLFEIPTPLYKTHRQYLKQHIKSNDLVIISGGGWMGNLWVHNEIMIRNIIEDYSMNQIIIFPQTLYYTEDTDGKNVARETRDVLKNHKNLYLTVRDANSYYVAQQLFGINDKHLLFCPDMVLYGTLASKNITKEKKKIALICMREDIEKAVNVIGIESITEVLGFCPVETTTVYTHLIKIKDRQRLLEKLITKYSEAEFMITDRLHAMIFSLLAGIPCYVFNNCTGKVFGVASYLSDADMPVKMFKNADEIKLEMLNLTGKQYKLNDELKEKFNQVGCLLSM